MDGHSQLLAASNPGVISYDPAFAFELVHIILAGIDRMYGPGSEEFVSVEQSGGPDRNVSYYITIYNEPVPQPPQPDDLDPEAVVRGLYRFRPAEQKGHPAQILASGVGMYAALEAQELLAEWGVAADLWSATSWNELAREGLESERTLLRDPSGEDPQEQLAKERGLTYVSLDGDIGILGNGAGLVMATLDVVAQNGGRAANFLDVGGGASADAMAASLDLVLSDDKVSSVFINIFGGITRGEEVANGVIEATRRLGDFEQKLVVRLDGTNAEEGRRILTEADHPNVIPAATMQEAAAEAVRLAGA